MNGGKIKRQILSLVLLMNMHLFAQNQPDMTVLFEYFDSTVTIYVDGEEIVIEGDGVPSHLSPYFVQTYNQTNNGMYYWQDENGDGVNDLAVGAIQDDEGTGNNLGAVHIMFMNTDGSVDSTVEIND